MRARAQSTVVGVAVLLALTVTSLAVLTAGVGSVIDGAASGAQVDRVADRFAELFPAATATGPTSGLLGVRGGVIETVSRTVRIRGVNETLFSREVNAVVYRVGNRRVTALAGAVLVGSPGVAEFVRAPAFSLASSNSSGAAYLAMPVFTSTLDRGLEGSTRLTIRVDSDAKSVAVPGNATTITIETQTPGAWERWFNASGVETTRQDLDGDGIPSVRINLPPGTSVHVVVIETTVSIDE